MTKTTKLVMCAMLIGVIILMAATPIGYLHAGAIEITFLTIPVIIGAMVLGKEIGAVLGLIFGLTSFGQCLGILGMSPFGAAILNINPVFTFILCIVPRILMGFLCGLIFEALYKKQKKALAFSVAGISGSLLNTILFTGTFFLLFSNTTYFSELSAGKNILAFAVAFVGLNGLLEAIACRILSSSIGAAIYKGIKKIN